MVRLVVVCLLGTTEMVTISDIVHHVVKIGVDVYPPISVSTNRTRLNVMFEKGNGEYPEVFARVVSGEQEFRISKMFSRTTGGSIEVPTLTMVDRGPVFSLPIVLQDVPRTGFENNYRDVLTNMRRHFFRAFADHKMLRLGLVREVIFDTGSESCVPVLGPPSILDDAILSSGNLMMVFQDEKCNIHVTLRTMQSAVIENLAIGRSIKPSGYGLGVLLDVNNKEIKPLEEDHINLVLDVAESLWPEKILALIAAREKRND